MFINYDPSLTMLSYSSRVYILVHITLVFIVCGSSFGDRSFITLNCLVACQSDEFACDNGRCIVRTQVCNYADNCGDKSDERGCSYPPGKLYVTCKLC